MPCLLSLIKKKNSDKTLFVRSSVVTKVTRKTNPLSRCVNDCPCFSIY